MSFGVAGVGEGRGGGIRNKKQKAIANKQKKPLQVKKTLKKVYLLVFSFLLSKDFYCQICKK